MSDKTESVLEEVFAHVDRAMEAAGDAINAAGKVVENAVKGVARGPERRASKLIRVRFDESSFRALAQGKEVNFKTSEGHVINIKF